MNRNKKKVFAAALAVCMLGILSFSTLAWFNASESVTNKFMVASTGSGTGDNNKPEDKIFSVDLWEKVDMNGDGTVADNELVSYRQDGLTGWDYKDILPGVKYHKEPTVENTGSYDQWIRMVVTVSDYNMFKKFVPVGSDLAEIFGGHDETKWTLDPASIKIDTSADTISYVYYLNEKLAPAAKAALFTDVTLPGVLTQKDMHDMGGEVEIKIHADAIQTSLGATAEEAFAAIGVDGWNAYESYDQAMAPVTNP